MITQETCQLPFLEHCPRAESRIDPAAFLCTATMAMQQVDTGPSETQPSIFHPKRPSSNPKQIGILPEKLNVRPIWLQELPCRMVWASCFNCCFSWSPSSLAAWRAWRQSMPTLPSATRSVIPPLLAEHLRFSPGSLAGPSCLFYCRHWVTCADVASSRISKQETLNAC